MRSSWWIRRLDVNFSNSLMISTSKRIDINLPESHPAPTRRGSLESGKFLDGSGSLRNQRRARRASGDWAMVLRDARGSASDLIQPSLRCQAFFEHCNIQIIHLGSISIARYKTYYERARPVRCPTFRENPPSTLSWAETRVVHSLPSAKCVDNVSIVSSSHVVQQFELSPPRELVAIPTMRDVNRTTNRAIQVDLIAYVREQGDTETVENLGWRGAEVKRREGRALPRRRGGKTPKCFVEPSSGVWGTFAKQHRQSADVNGKTVFGM
ncbi:hypothetical protein F5887DRAFT_916682 [Amanita rubescens]|nr:hypothetical protein F5887DRAFT_916682 [Amanita rubescens]